MRREILTKETCHEIAKSCTSRDDFKQVNLHAYNLAKRAGWLSKWFPIHRTLTKDECAAFARTCSSRSDLGEKDPAIYQKCRKAGWLDEFFPDKMRTLTHDVCKEIASLCSSRSELKASDGAAYEASRKHGWLAEFFPECKHAGRTLTKELCREIASKCSSRSDFNRVDGSAYLKSLKCGWLVDFFPDENIHHPYTYDECRNIALKCASKADFKRANAVAYAVSRRNGWLAEFTHFKESKVVRSEAMRKYTDDEVIAEAKKYSILSDFRKLSPAMYQIASRRKLIPTFNWLEQPSVKNSDVIYAYEFDSLNHAYIGRTVYPARRDAQHRLPGDSVYEFAKEHNVDVPEPKYIKVGLNPVTEGCNMEREIIEQYKESGWSMINKTAGGELGFGRKYSKKQCLETAMKYVYKIDFLRNDTKIYRFAKAHGYIDSYKWLKSSNIPRSHWSYENCSKEAAKYESRMEFYACNQGAYHAAKRNGWLDELFPVK